MSITVRSKRTNEQSLSFGQWEDDRQHDTVLLESLAMIATIQADGSICVIALHDEITFVVYGSFIELRHDLDIDQHDGVIAISAIDIAYTKALE